VELKLAPILTAEMAGRSAPSPDCHS